MIGGVVFQGAPGVWLGSAKVAAVGVAVSKWHTMHGLALNVAPNMEDYNRIVACGLEGKGVTSLVASVPGLQASPALMAEVKARTAKWFENVFNMDLAPASFPSLALPPVPYFPLERK
jgi:lipoyl(octanoyl) transferase